MVVIVLAIRLLRLDARLAAAAWACTVISGCVVPVPEFTKPTLPYLEKRQLVFERLPEFIVPGQTTRDEVLKQLGEPDVRGWGDRWFVYQWGEDRTGVRMDLVSGWGMLRLMNFVPVFSRSIVVYFDWDGNVDSVDQVKREDLCGGIGPEWKIWCTGGLVEPADWRQMLDKDYAEAASGLFLLEPDEQVRQVFRGAACRSDERWIEGAAFVSNHAVVFLDRTSSDTPFNHVRLRLAREEIAGVRVEENGTHSSPIAVIDLIDSRRIEIAFGLTRQTSVAPPFDPVRTRLFVSTVQYLAQGR